LLALILEAFTVSLEPFTLFTPLALRPEGSFEGSLDFSPAFDSIGLFRHVTKNPSQQIL